MLNSINIVKIKSFIESEIIKLKLLYKILTQFEVKLFMLFIMRTCLHAMILSFFTVFFYSKTIDLIDIYVIFYQKLQGASALRL